MSQAITPQVQQGLHGESLPQAQTNPAHTSLTEGEIRPEALMAEQARLFAEDVARLMRQQDHFIDVPCPACQSITYEFAFTTNNLPFVSCLHCQTLFATPRPRPEHMADYYQNSKNYQYWSQHIFPASEQARREKIFKPRVRQVLEICERLGLPTRTLLEVGAGFGLFCEEMKATQRFQRVIAVEPTPSLAADCRQRGIEVFEQTIESLDKTHVFAPGETLDVIANFEVIEHLFSPRDFLQQCADLLDTGGILIITCPNGQGFDITILREHSCAVDVEHVNLFNPHSLSLLLEQCGFEVLERQTPGQLDAELVRKAFLSGVVNPEHHLFFKHLLVDHWEQYGAAFQTFLRNNGLSSNMLLVARKR